MSGELVIVAHLSREVYEYQSRNGGKSPEMMLVPKSVFDAIEMEARSYQNFVKDDRSASGVTTICGVKVLIDPSMRIARFI